MYHVLVRPSHGSGDRKCNPNMIRKHTAHHHKVVQIQNNSEMVSANAINVRDHQAFRKDNTIEYLKQ